MSSQNIRRRDIERALEEYTGINNQQSLGVGQANVVFQAQTPRDHEALVARVAENAEALKANNDLHTRSNQLINQLYHDIARLERVKQDAVAIIQDIWHRSHEDYEELDMVGLDDYSRGILQEFVDTHGGD